MTAIVDAVPQGYVSRQGGRLRLLLTKAIREPAVTFCALVVVLMVIVAIAAPILAPYPPSQVILGAANQGPSVEHWLGTDKLGRDVLSRLMWGARSSFIGGAIVVMLATTFGVLLATVAAWRGGRLDSAIAAFFDVVFSFPGLLLAIGAAAVFGVGFWAPVLALAVSYTPYVGRIIRSAAIRERGLPYIEALVVQGQPGRRIVTRHILPNLRELTFAQATLAFAWATIDLAAIAYLGLGVQPPGSDWGLMVSEGQPGILANNPGPALYPGICLVILVISVTVIGRRLGRTAEQNS